MVEPGNVPDDVAQYVHPQEWDGVFVHNAFRPQAYFSSGSPVPYNTGWTDINSRDDLGYNQDALAGGVHEPDALPPGGGGCARGCGRTSERRRRAARTIPSESVWAGLPPEIGVGRPQGATTRDGARRVAS
ncbi:hypothetical protein [Dactylosporangium sp. NPDC000521]|uniref:hypothetical protein n=1 Tax=Dactylosporangium sp. NPDC000521 TaxID=3363975 RepID=UPI0036928894